MQTFLLLNNLTNIVIYKPKILQQEIHYKPELPSYQRTFTNILNSRVT